MATGDEVERQAGEIAVWSTRDWSLLFQQRGGDSLAHEVVFSPDGQWIAAATERTGPTTLGKEPGFVKVLDSRSGEILKTLSGHLQQVYSVAFSWDSRRLLSGGRMGSLDLWDTTTWEPLLTDFGEQQSILDVAIDDQNQALMTVDQTGTMRLWRIGDSGNNGTWSPSPEQIVQWHVREADSSEGLRFWYSAAFHLSRLIDNDNVDLPALHARRGRAYAGLARWEDAIDDFEVALTTRRDDGPLRLRHALALEQAARLEESRSEYVAAAALSGAIELTADGGWNRRFKSLAMNETESRRWDEVFVDAQVDDTADWSFSSWRSAGLACAAMAAWQSAHESERSPQFWDVASTCFENSVSIQSEDIHSLRGLARCQAEISSWEVALDTCEDILEVEPQDGAIRFLGGVCNHYLGRFQSALEEFDRAIESGFNGGGVRAQYELTRLFLELEDGTADPDSADESDAP